MSLETLEAAILAEVTAEFEDNEAGASLPEVVYVLDKIKLDLHLSVAVDEDDEGDDEDGTEPDFES
jgi:hypothetical protein